MRTDAHARSAGRTTRIESLLLLIVLSAKAPAFGQQTAQQGAAPTPATPPTAASGAGAAAAPAASGTSIEIASQATPAGTPFTMNRYTSNHMGAIYGWDASPKSLATRLAMETPVPGLFLAGHWTRPGGGIYAVITSGQIAAKRVMRELESLNSSEAVRNAIPV